MALGRGTLPKQYEAGDDEGQQRCGCRVAAQRQPASTDGLVEKVADHGAQRPREDEGRPEQSSARDWGPVVRCDDQHQQRAEHGGAAGVAQPGCNGRPVAERGSQGLGRRSFQYDCQSMLLKRLLDMRWRYPQFLDRR